MGGGDDDGQEEEEGLGGMAIKYSANGHQKQLLLESARGVERRKVVENG